MSPVSAEDLLEQLRATVAKRRAAGEYPPGLEEALDRHFLQIAVQPAARYDHDELRRRIGELVIAGSFSVDDIAFDTRVPGGTQLHRAVAKIVGRQTAGILAQAQRHADAVREVLDEVLRALETPAAHTHAELDQRIAMAADALAAAQRAAQVPSALAGLEARVRALETGAPHTPTTAAPAAAATAGTPPTEAERAWLLGLADRFAGAPGPVLVVADADGSFRSRLGAAGIEPAGSDATVTAADARAALAGLPDAALGGICVLDEIGLLPPEEVVALLAAAHTKLATGGRIALRVSGSTAPATVPPPYLQFLVHEAGFGVADVSWGPPATLLSTLPGDDDVASIHNANIERLNRFLGVARDYAVVALR